jgi:ATP-dependent Clp protease ATP-binding subunit ClpA
MKRAITNVIMNGLSTKILSGEVDSGDNIELDIDKNENLVVNKK